MNAENANSTLEEMLGRFQTAGDLKVLESAAQGINGILYGAITQYPTKVNAVRIAASISINRGEDGLPHAGTTSSGRVHLKEFLRGVLGTDAIPELIPLEFVEYLPYKLTAGGRNESLWRNVDARTYVFNDRTTAYFAIGVSGYLPLGEGIYLFPDEISSITLEKVLDGEFTPHPELRDGKYRLREPLSSVLHYISFREFSKYGVKEEDIPDGKWKKDVAAIASNVWLPEWPTGLFEDKGKPIPTKELILQSILQLIDPLALIWPYSLSGFAVDASGKGPVLYEFNNAKVPRRLRFESNAVQAAYIIAHHRANPGPNIKTYEGDEIIGRLSQVPIKKVI